MNERVMQFRLGMFVIVAGLVLTMLIVWFGESPSLFRDRTYVTVHYSEAPGVAEGIPVRKSGIRIGEVASIRFEDRPVVSGKVLGVTDKDVIIDIKEKGQGALPLAYFPKGPPGVGEAVNVVVGPKDRETQRYRLALPDGVLVTLALDKKYKIKAGAEPRISRALIGDVSIDMLPGTGQGDLLTADNPSIAPIIEGTVAPDPAGALAAATSAFEKVGGTLDSIKTAADGLSGLTKKAEKLDLDSFTDMGKKVGTLAAHFDDLIKANEGEIKPAIASLRRVVDKLDNTLDPATQANLQKVVEQLNGDTAKLDGVLTDLGPLAKDLGAPAGTQPTTNLGQAMMRMNRISYEVGLLSQTLVDPKDPKGTRLNPNGSLQKLLTTSELHDNWNVLATSARDVLSRAGSAIRNLNIFSERIARDPAVIGSGVLRPH
jgi:phospholipid/cholesterol/gamma-HCH transport system substrate-binding protein